MEEGHIVKEYALDMEETGNFGVFSCEVGDLGSLMIDDTYYDVSMHGESGSPGWRITKYNAEAEALYDLLEREVIPEFYTRNKRGIPTAWVARMRESMARLTTQFSANRAVREYSEHHYIPAAAAYRERAADKGAVGVQVVNWQHRLEQKWAALRFGEMKVVSNEGKHVFEVEIYLGSLDPDSVRVELYANGVNGGEPECQAMTRGRGQQSTDVNSTIYSAQVPSTRPATDYTARVIPQHDGVAVPLEAARILWQR